MSLKALVSVTREIPVWGSSITVQGLSGSDLRHIFHNQGAFIGRELKSLTEVLLLDGSPDRIDAFSILTAVLDQAPPLIASLIACGCGYPDDPEAHAIATRLPLGVQIEALEAILALSFSDGSGREAFATVVRAVQTASALTNAEFAAAMIGRN